MERRMNEIDLDNINKFLSLLGFSLKEGEADVYYKKFAKVSNYEIKINLNRSNFEKSKIDYGDKITVIRGTTANFSQQETFVILECVSRLLDKGYKPESIVLEKDWRLGHKEKGNLDIQVLDTNSKSFIMIECKTWDSEYKSEKKEMYNNGGQLFSYFVQDKSTKYLCLYTSVLDQDKITYETAIVKLTDEMRQALTQKDAFEKWKPQIFENRGIFEEGIAPYNIKFSGLRKKDLKDLTKEDGGDIYNRFAEILRRNIVSDKTNAYNKIFNLFLCKIVDEYEKDKIEAKLEFQWEEVEAKLEFQWEEGEDNETVLLRLNDLYKRGMSDYLNLEITSITMDYLQKNLENLKNEKDKEKIKHLFIEQKLYTSNEFAFKEVFDKKTFDLNCIVVKEVVKLLELYRIRYETKQQFLGDFFEKLLNTGIKQEAGQFFTPVPLAQFMCKSLPIWDIIKEKNNKQEINFLPYVIDYASGAGHFLTEIMAEINGYIETKIDDEFIKGGRRAKDDFNSLKNNMLWAKEYIYGIEKDYRLAKTTKIATFLNGDGDAIIICGDGLDNFRKSEDYKGKLKVSTGEKTNEQFDIVIANPPYSISGFKTTIKNGDESFDLISDLTDKSKEIECLFVERTEQLLKIDGVAAIILPSSILSNTGLYTQTREFLLQNFDIKGIVELGANTFMATGTNTIITFLKRVENRKDAINELIEKSMTNKKDLAINGIENPIKKYLEKTYVIELEEYFKLLENNEENTEFENIATYKEYIKLFKSQRGIKQLNEFVKNNETDKLLYFILSYNKRIIVSNIPQNIKDEKDFLGYEFSNRRGQEGINIFDLGGKLYNKDNLEDDTKVNYYVLKNFKNEDIVLNEKADTVSIYNLNELMNFDVPEFEKIIGLNKKKDVKFKEGIEIAELSSKVDVKIGGTPSRKVKPYYKGDNLWVSIEEMDGNEISDTEEKITDEAITKSNVKLIKKGTTLLSFKLSIGKTAIAGKDLYTNEAIAGLEIRPEHRKEVLDRYLFYLFSSKLIQSLLTKENNIFGKSLNKPFLEKVKIPFPSETVQREIIDAISDIEKKELSLRKDSEYNEKQISNLIKSAGGKEMKISSLLQDVNCKINKAQKGDVLDEGKYPVISQEKGDVIGYVNDITPITKENLPLVIFGDHNKEIKYIDYEFVVGADGVKLLRPNDLIEAKFFYYALKNVDMPPDNKYSRHYRILKDLTIKVPDKDTVQKQVLKELVKFDDRIKANNLKIESLENEKESVIQKHLT